ncbi:GspE/PulE family protein [Helicobacter sp. 13S00477-4]|uniref:GspE/PulE family protein n=1 Tax=Helicobacter sp. 13S00477-4 TaxID=1905759 RepID=UPI000BA73E96|nr:GspE/PulE family protein [Helicobacter sp. 13S00477-4]PAF52320.1 hypothetical protein BKH44_03165 [Helicobacter sp. 13S00477-4]
MNDFLNIENWIIDEKSSILIPYKLAAKLKTFVFSISPTKQQIILATLHLPSQNKYLFEELIKQKYPSYAFKFSPISPKDFYNALEHIKIQEKIYYFSTQITESIDHQNNIDELYEFILQSAIDQKASDLHLESKSNYTSFRIRKDGKIKEVARIKSEIFELLCNKIKLESKLDISEKRLPQDGRYSFIFDDKKYDFRISTLPIWYGESIVIRILYKQNRQINLSELNISTYHLNIIQKSIQSPHGIILITGPTGSGKSTTLYALLESIKSSEKKLITIEDPIEYQINLANQVQINPDYGFGFPQALRSILRQDPDIIMVGEIRDQETLQLAIESSLTGHLVLSTIHTNDCISTLDRLLDMGIQPYLLNTSLIAIISQRLVRKLCPHCKIPHKNPPENFSTTLFTAQGCDECNMQGFIGREAIVETLQMTPKIKSLLSNGSSLEIKKFLKQTDFKTLFDDGFYKATQGITTYEEICRIATK